VEIELLPGAEKRASEFLESYHECRTRLKKVAELIEGFETPYGMELLSSVHWVAHHDSAPIRDADEAVQRIHDWNERKRRMFRPRHIRVAWGRLAEKDCLS